MQKSEFKQSLLVTHFEDTTFKALEANNGAPRPQFLYRQLGVEEATGGAYDAHVIKGMPGSKPPIAEHKHTELEFLFDESIAHQDRVEQLLQELNQNQPAADPAAPAPPVDDESSE